MEKKIPNNTISTDDFGLKIVTAPLFEKYSVMFVINVSKLLWNFFMELRERASYDYLLGKPHYLPGKVFVTVYVNFIKISLKYRAWNAVKKYLKKLEIVPEDFFNPLSPRYFIFKFFI